MQNQPVAKNPVLIQLPTGLYLGLVCFNPLYENLRFVLEKKDFFEMEWPTLVVSQETGLFPMLLGLPYITIQRAQILWYTTHVPTELLKQYQAFLPLLGPEGLPQLEVETDSPEKAKNKKEGKTSKIIPLIPKKGSPHVK